MFKLNGIIKVAGETVQMSEKFSKRDLVITDDSSMYPQDIAFQLAQDKCPLLDTFNVGDRVEVSFNIRGKAWQSPHGETKYFNTLDAWRIELVSQGTMPEYKDPSPMDAPSMPMDDTDDELPF